MLNGRRACRAGVFQILLGGFLIGVISVAVSAELRPGQAVAGLQASIAVDRVEGSIGGEGPNMTFVLTNTSARPIWIFNRLEIAWPGTVSAATVNVAIARLDGVAYEPAERISNLTAGPRPEEFAWLAPGESVSTGPVSLVGGRAIRHPGWFRITVSYRNQFTNWVSQDGVVHEEPDVWTGSVASNALTIVVRP